MADLRHPLRAAAIRKRESSEARLRNRDSEWRGGAPSSGDHRPDGAPHREALRAASTGGTAGAAGSRYASAVQEYLGAADKRIRPVKEGCWMLDPGCWLEDALRASIWF